MLTCVSAARAATLTPDSTFILGGAPSLLAPLPAPVADSASGPQSVDQTGRFVAFASNSDGLSAAADPAVTNIYVKDRLTGAVTLVSRQTGTDGAPTSQDCFLPAISDDGSHVAFVCDGALDPADNNDKPDVYVRELATGKTILVSRATGADGAVGNGDSESPALNADGSRIAFDSDSTNLGGTTDGSRQVYVRVLPSVASSGATLLVSIAGGAGAPMPDGDSQSPSIDDNGDTIGFESKATNLAAGDTNGTTDVFVHSISKNTTRLESRARLPGTQAGMSALRGNACRGRRLRGGTCPHRRGPCLP